MMMEVVAVELFVGDGGGGGSGGVVVGEVVVVCVHVSMYA